MAKVERDALSGVETTGHEWDGLKELNNPLPKWWLYVFYVCILWAVVYWVLYPAWPIGGGATKGIYGWSQRTEIEEQLAVAKKAQAKFTDVIQATPIEEIKGKPDLVNFAMAGGRALFNENCAACHGAGGAGAKGFPTLADDDWLWGGKVTDIQQSILHGIRADDPDARVGDMPAFGKDGTLAAAQVNDVAEYVLSLSSKSTDAAAAARGQAVFAEQCVACHGEDAKGNAELGAPNLADGIWLFGGDKASVVETLNNGRKGVMPAWAKRLDEVAVKQLAVYVHSLGGGK
ncbi:MAG TPA: cytochrome-c oxidase, cbb3-type subunit III [Azospirillaceae bacterium]|nr:cytochrome-c oxidase, cbb3-type subunit III [Azospirillaceae bacterium]